MPVPDITPTPPAELYSPREIASAAGVREADVVAALGGRRFAGHAEAVRVGCALAYGVEGSAGGRAGMRTPRPLFAMFADTRSRSRPRGGPLIVSTTLHAGLAACLAFLATFNVAPRAETLNAGVRADPLRLVFLATPGPGGGGGGGGLRQAAPAPRAMREGRHPINSPVPARRAPKLSMPAPAPAPEPDLNSEPLPALVAPIVTAPADGRDRIGVLEASAAKADSHGRGAGGGAGTGSGTGLGAGQGRGVGPGSGGGTGGGPYRPGSGIEPPRLLREVKADYTEEARRRGLAGDVLLEIVVRRDGTVGDVHVLEGLGAGLDDRAVQAVRQWGFAPATRLGSPVDVIVEVAVEFQLR